jgi:hypothetical protein
VVTRTQPQPMKPQCFVLIHSVTLERRFRKKLGSSSSVASRKSMLYAALPCSRTCSVVADLHAARWGRHFLFALFFLNERVNESRKQTTHCATQQT